MNEHSMPARYQGLRLLAARLAGQTYVAVMISLLCPATIGAQSLLWDALASFPLDTVHLEYSQPSKLRVLPNYSGLRRHYLGQSLQTLGPSMLKLGLREDEIGELVLGWQAGAMEEDVFGIAAGPFDPAAIAEHAGTQRLPPTSVGGLPAYCFDRGARATCVVVLEKSLGAFGGLKPLSRMLEIRAGQGTGLNSDEHFMEHVREAWSRAPIWGIAVGPAAADWFRAAMPSEGSLRLDWARTFQAVNALAYSIEPGEERVHLEVKLDCKTPEQALSLWQGLEGLKLIQKLAWENKHPNRPNAIEDVIIGLNDRLISLELNTSSAILEDGQMQATDP